MTGKLAVRSLPVLLSSRTRPSCRKASTRKPSSFGSKTHSGDEKGASTACANIGVSDFGIRAGLPRPAAPRGRSGSGIRPDCNWSMLSPHTIDRSSSSTSRSPDA